MKNSNSHGTACFWGVEAGPKVVSFFDSADAVEPIASYPITVFEQRHFEKTFYLDEAVDLQSGLTLLSEVNEDGLEDQMRASYESSLVEWAELVLPDGEELFAEAGAVTRNHASLDEARLAYFSIDAQYEPTAYHFDLLGGYSPEHVTPLIPAGYIQDIANKAGIHLEEPDYLGSVMVDFSFADEDEFGVVSVQLRDYSNRPVGDILYVSKGSTENALFFNVPPGKYTATVEGEEGQLVASDTLTVYPASVSYEQMGHQLVIKERPVVDDW